MKVTRRQLREIIVEEISLLEEQELSLMDLGARRAAHLENSQLELANALQVTEQLAAHPKAAQQGMDVQFQKDHGFISMAFDSIDELVNMFVDRD